MSDIQDKSTKQFDYFISLESRFDGRFGDEQQIQLGNYSDLMNINIKIKKYNLTIDLEIPEECALLVPQQGTFFSLENLARKEHPNYKFTTKYRNVDNIRGAVPIKRKYCPQELVEAMSNTSNSELIFELYAALLFKILQKSSIDTLEDIVRINKFGEENLQINPGYFAQKTAQEIVNQLLQTGKYEGSCKERTMLVKWLFCVGGIDNKRHFGVYVGKDSDDLGMHTFNEARMTKDGEKFTLPVDWHNVPDIKKGSYPFPFLREDARWVYYLQGFLPKIVAKNNSNNCCSFDNGDYQQKNEERVTKLVTKTEKEEKFPCKIKISEEQ